MWIPILLFVIFVTKVQCELLLVSQTNSLHCVSTDENSALEWIFPTNDKALQSVTESSTGWRSQNEKQEEFYCNFRENCPGLPKQNIKINTKIETSEFNFGPITDTRWNYFPVKGAIYRQELPFGDTLVFHLSILAADDGFIILSENQDLTKTPAYWFILDGWGQNTSSVLRKCSNGIYEGPNCPTKVTKHKDRVLENGKRWVHFTIEIKETQEFSTYIFILKTVEITLKVEGRVYFQWTDTEKLFFIQYVSFQRYQNNKPAFWKYHQYNVFQQEQNTLEIPIQATAHDGKICVSLTYFSDKEITVQILGSNNALATQTLQSSANKWKIQTIEARTSQSDKYNLQIYKDSSTVLYLGEIRTCHTNEFFVTKLQVAKSQFSSIKCRNSQSNEEIQISNTKQENVCEKKSSFGANCGLSCKTILGVSCSAGKMCDARGCFCLPGYHAYGCNTACYNNTYGTDCSGTCGKCASSSCDTQTGVCTSGCSLNLYKTPFCTEEPSLNLVLIIATTTVCLVLLLCGLMSMFIWFKAKTKKMNAMIENSRNIPLQNRGTDYIYDDVLPNEQREQEIPTDNVYEDIEGHYEDIDNILRAQEEQRPEYLVVLPN